MLGGNEEFCGVNLAMASSFPIRSSSDSTKARTAGVISASSSGGIVNGLFSADDMIHVVPKNPFHVQISLPKNVPQGVNHYKV